MTEETSPARQLVNAIELWHAAARKLDAGSHFTHGGPATHARIWVSKNASGRPGKVLTKLALTARHADYLASCIAGATAFASSSPWALGQWLEAGHPAEAGSAVCWLVIGDHAGHPHATVPLDPAGASGFVTELDSHAVWLARESTLRAVLPLTEGDRVEVVGSAPHLHAVRGAVGTLIAIKLVQAEPEPRWHFDVRLDDAQHRWPTAFREGEIARRITPRSPADTTHPEERP